MCSMLLMVVIALLPLAADAQSLPMVSVQTGADGAQTWSLSIQILLLMTSLTLLPAVLLMMTSFTRIIIVLSFMRQAIGSAQTPPNQVL
ncbi:MAG: flagellar biosynthetic protein FliP, partial [Gammaproteobacteria bacterium HGW-Gammaproteobacteria-6]